MNNFDKKEMAEHTLLYTRRSRGSATMVGYVPRAETHPPDQLDVTSKTLLPTENFPEENNGVDTIDK